MWLHIQNLGGSDGLGSGVLEARHGHRGLVKLAACTCERTIRETPEIKVQQERI